MDNTKKPYLPVIEFCAGYGGLFLGCKRVMPDLCCIALGEIEAFACANLVAKMEAGLLDPAPIWTDIKTFPACQFRDRVFLLTAGYPCQPFSAAGKRGGSDDPRHLWPHIRRAAQSIRPRYVFFENVEGHISLGLSTVLSDLEEDGYTATWGIFSAEECGAPHRRKRVFILGRLDDPDSSERRTPAQGRNERNEHDGGRDKAANGFSPPGEKLVHASIARSGTVAERPEGKRLCDPHWTSEELAYTTSSRRPGRQDARASGGDEGTRARSVEPERDGCKWPARPNEQQHRWEPPRTVAESRLLDRTRWSSRTGWRDGLTSDVGAIRAQRYGVCEVKPAMGRDLDGIAARLDYAGLHTTADSRTDELRLLGNGVVPATAERAFRTLWDELEEAHVMAELEGD